MRQPLFVMRRLLFVILVVLILGTVIVEAQKITGVNQPKGAGGTGTSTTGTKPAKGANYYYVAGESGYDPNTAKAGDEIPAGATFQSDKPITSDNVITIAPEQYKLTQQYKGNYEYNYDENNRYTFTATKTDTKQGDEVNNLFENYQVITTTSVSVDENGNVIKSYDQVTKICGEGLTTCTGTYEEIPGSHQTRTETWNTIEKTDPNTGKTETRTVLTGTTTTVYDSREKGGGPSGYFTVTYGPSEKGNELSTRTPNGAEYKGADGIVYYSATTDANGNVKVDNNIDDIPDTDLSRADKDALRERAVRSGALGFTGTVETLAWYQTTGRFIRAYYEYAGLRQLSSLLWPSYDAEVQDRKAKIQQQFCLAAGITNCVISTICGEIYPIDSDNVLAGRGPGGKYVTSAVINAEKSIPIEVEGMTRQQLIDIFGNSTVIKGVLINLTNPAFDPRVLGRLKLRLYHIQYAVTNNAEDQEDMAYNIEFRNVDERLNSSYGAPIGQARWWTDKTPTVSYLATARDDLYKFSATGYNSVCLTFGKDLPSGHALYSSMVDELCVPIVEYAGPPTEIGTGPGAETPPPAGVAPGAAPGASI